MGRTLQLGDTPVDETKLADLCGRYRVRDLSLFGSAARGDMRSRKKPLEDAVFGFRAAGPALLANTSCFEKRMCHWDPEAITVRQ